MMAMAMLTEWTGYKEYHARQMRLDGKSLLR